MLLLLIASGDTFTAAANEDEERKGKKRKRKKKANERAMATTAATMDTVLRECLGCRLVPLCLLPSNGCVEKEGVDEKWQKRRENG